MEGTRVYPVGGVISLAEGEYGQSDDGTWYARPPAPGIHMGSIALDRHNVNEHEDGTITVVPSILIQSGNESWHGYLERGRWRTA